MGIKKTLNAMVIAFILAAIVITFSAMFSSCVSTTKHCPTYSNSLHKNPINHHPISLY
jgi:multisubunit Na+/H+ antiporter MnhC subunit